MIAPPQQAVTSFAEEQSPELRDRIFDEFNSLAVIYREPAAAFQRRAAADADIPEVCMVLAAYVQRQHARQLARFFDC